MHALPFDDPTFLSEGIIKQITVFFTNRRRVYFTKHNGLIGFENTAIMEYCSFYVCSCKTFFKLNDSENDEALKIDPVWWNDRPLCDLCSKRHEAHQNYYHHIGSTILLNGFSNLWRTFSVFTNISCHFSQHRRSLALHTHSAINKIIHFVQDNCPLKFT